jgi:hypothetical protein
MENCLIGDVAAVDRHLQGVGDQGGPHVCGGLPAHHHPGGQIDDGGQVQPAFTGAQVGDVPTSRCPGASAVRSRSSRSGAATGSLPGTVVRL